MWHPSAAMPSRVNPGTGCRNRDHWSGSGPGRAARSAAKRAAIVEAAIDAFAELGYDGVRIEALAAALGIAKGSVFAHFGSKAGLFLAAYRAAVRRLPGYRSAPEAVLEAGFFATIRYWLERTGHLVREDLRPYRVTLIGNYGTDLALRHEINRFLADEDPYGTVAFVQRGIDRGEVRADLPLELLVSTVDWLVERFQDAQVTEELDPGLFRRPGTTTAERAARIDQFAELLRSAIGVPGR